MVIFQFFASFYFPSLFPWFPMAFPMDFPGFATTSTSVSGRWRLCPRNAQGPQGTTGTTPGIATLDPWICEISWVCEISWFLGLWIYHLIHLDISNFNQFYIIYIYMNCIDIKMGFHGHHQQDFVFPPRSSGPRYNWRGLQPLSGSALWQESAMGQGEIWLGDGRRWQHGWTIPHFVQWFSQQHLDFGKMSSATFDWEYIHK